MLGASLLTAVVGLGATTSSTDHAKDHLASAVVQEKSENAVLKREVKRLRKSNHGWHRYARKVEREKGRLLHVVADLRSKLARLSPHPVGAAVPAWFRSQALCVHSHEGSWTSATGNGFWGGMQFMLSTWASVGGRGNPANASPSEQIYRAYLVYRRDGNSWREWPNTARMCGLL